MPINQLSTANTFSQWLGATQSLIDKSNYYEYTTNTVFNTANSVALLNMAITNTSNSINAQTAIITATSVSINNTSNSINAQTAIITATSVSINNTSNLVNAQTSVVLSTSNNIYAYVNAAYDTANAIYTIVANTEVATITDDNTTNNSYSILLSQNTSGGLLRTNVSSQKLSFNPGTGRLTTNVVNSTFITSNTTLVTNLNADYLDGQHGSYFAPLASPTLTGAPKSPTAAVDTANTMIATTEFVVGQASATTPVMDSVGTVGTSTRYARADHIHPSDTSKANLASPTFSGTVVLPSTTSIGSVSSTEIGYLDGVTSAIQTQLNAKAPLSGPTFTGTVVLPSTTSIGTVSSTEIGYLDGVTSAIQTQIDAKQATLVSGTNIKTVNGTTLLGSGDITASTSEIKYIGATVASNALTLTLYAGSLDFRSSTLTSGIINTRSYTDKTLVVPSGATLGTNNTVASRLILIAIDNSGTVELAVTNLKGSSNLDETSLISTTAISTAADKAGVIYSTTARSNVPFRVVGFIDITETTAGTWAAAPTQVQGCGGQAIAAMSSIGYGQTYQSVARVFNTTYYNTTGKPIFLSISGDAGSVIIGGVNVALSTYGNGYIIPAGSYYSFSGENGTFTELR